MTVRTTISDLAARLGAPTFWIRYRHIDDHGLPLAEKTDMVGYRSQVDECRRPR